VEAAAEVDHIVPLARGGTHDLANLQPLCKSCHSKKTMRESVSGKLATAAVGLSPIVGALIAGFTHAYLTGDKVEAVWPVARGYG